MKLTNYTLILTDNCNLRCTYCFDNLYSDRTCHSKDMTIDMIPNIFHFIQKTRDKNKPITINLFGGEPTLNWDFFKSFVELAREYLNFEYRITTTTNGTLLNTEKIDFLKKHHIGTSVSLDGTAKSNKERITKDKSPTWDNVMNVLPELKAKLPSTSILMTVGKHNYLELEESYEMLLDIGFKPIINFDTYLDYTLEELQSTEKQLTSLFVTKKLPLTGSIDRKLKESWLCDGTVCTPADKSITIAPNGKLYFCHQFVPKMINTEDMSYGNIKDGITNQELFNTFVNRSYINQFSKDSNSLKCGRCSIVDSCKGGCMAEQWHKTKSFEKVNNMTCAINIIIDDVLKRRK